MRWVSGFCETSSIISDMYIIPAIDIIDGKCVRLTQGDYDQKKVYNEDPLEVAKAFEGAGLERKLSDAQRARMRPRPSRSSTIRCCNRLRGRPAYISTLGVD